MKNYYDGRERYTNYTPETHASLKRDFHFEQGVDLSDLQTQHRSLVKLLNDAPNSPRPSNEYDDLAALEAVLRHMIEQYNRSVEAALIEEGTDAALRQSH